MPVLGLTLLPILFLSACSVREPTLYGNKEIVLYENATVDYEALLGTDRNETFVTGPSGRMMVWPEGSYVTACKRKICLVDTDRNDEFDHVAVMKRPKLYPVDKQIPYKIFDRVTLMEPGDDYTARNYETVHIPSLGDINTVEIGEPMFSKIYRVTYRTGKIFIAGDYDIDITTPWEETIGTSIHPGDQRIMLRKNDGSVVLTSDKVNLIDIGNTGAFTHASYYLIDNPEPLKEPIPYVPEMAIKYVEDSFKYVALYQGRAGESIRVSYREFKDDMARPAFTQEIDYTLATDGRTTIGFKGMRIEVIKATNTNISYKVLHDYE